MKLKKFEGHDVLETSIAVTNAGDGLSAALAVDPQEFQIGEKVYVVLETEVSKIRHEPLKDSPTNFRRVHILKAGNATTVDSQLVAGVLDEQRRKLEEAAGVISLFPADGEQPSEEE